MANEKPFSQYPQKRIRPYDGMSITADVWEQAHAYHEKIQQTHNLYFHGSGILTGLDVVASDPPDRLVYILPGVAVDPGGKLIVLSEPVAYDVGNDIEGMLYLLLSYRESSGARSSGGGARSSGGGGNGGGNDSDPDYVETQFLITARPNIPDLPVIELARFFRENRNASLQDATDPFLPRNNEIDLRYRPSMALPVETMVSAGVVYLGAVQKKLHGRGFARAARELRKIAQVHLVVDDQLQLGPNVLGYGLLCLVGEGSFQLSAAQIKGLQGYLERGGTLLLECCNEAARTSFLSVSAQFGTGLQRLAADHPLLGQTYLFAAPPPGAEKTGEVLAGDGVILSTYNHLSLLAGETGNASHSSADVPAREDIRAVVEWLANLLGYTLERRAGVSY